MKLSKIIIWTSIIYIGGSFLACTDLPFPEECLIDTKVEVTPVSNCQVPCEKTISLRSFELISPTPILRWTLTKGTTDIPLSNPSASSFAFEFQEAGEYLVSVDISFNGIEGCDDQLSFPLTLGEDRPVAGITVNKTECIVGDCEIIFTDNSSENTDKIAWIFPNDTQDGSKGQEITRSFNECPDTITVKLVAENLSGIPDTASVTIFVEPVTFDKSHDISSLGTLEKVMCIEETLNSGFNLIGNTSEESYIAAIARGGELSSSKTLNKDLPTFFGRRTVRECHVVDGQNMLVGRVRNDNTRVNVAYLLVVDGQYTSGSEHEVFPGLPGDVDLWDITKKVDGTGYIACGAKSSGADEGMIFFELDLDFDWQQDIIHFEGDGNIAYAIESLSDGYMIVGEEGDRGCSFKLNEQLKLEGQPIYYDNFKPDGELVKVNDQLFIMLGSDGQTAKIVAFGNQSWDQAFGTTILRKAMVTSKGQLAVIGHTVVNGKRTPLFLKLAQDGSILQNLKFPADTNRELFALSETKENGFVLGGFNSGQSDQMFVLRLNKNGEILN